MYFNIQNVGIYIICVGMCRIQRIYYFSKYLHSVLRHYSRQRHTDNIGIHGRDQQYLNAFTLQKHYTFYYAFSQNFTKYAIFFLNKQIHPTQSAATRFGRPFTIISTHYVQTENTKKKKKTEKRHVVDFEISAIKINIDRNIDRLGSLIRWIWKFVDNYIK